MTSFNPCRVFSGLATEVRRERTPFRWGGFNPCRVFSGLATVPEEQRPAPILQSFNPCRVFSGLATSGSSMNTGEPKSFNPCRVFSGLATVLHRADETVGMVSIPVGFFQALQLGTVRSFSIRYSSGFQSLSGFFRPCNRERHQEAALFQWRFNPCRVFSGLATLRRAEDRDRWCQVSIPVGFFQALQQCLSCRYVSFPEVVSIPVGFFQALQQVFWDRFCEPDEEFQSLSGFFRPCNNGARTSRFACR